MTLEKALDIARAAESTAAQIKVMTVESGLNAVKQKEKEQSDDTPLVNDNRIRNLARPVRIVKRRIIL